MLTRKLHLAQKLSDEDLILLLGDKRKFFRDFRAESQLQTVSANTISEDSKKQKQVNA